MFSGVPNGPLRLSPPQVHAAVHNSGNKLAAGGRGFDIRVLGAVHLLAFLMAAWLVLASARHLRFASRFTLAAFLIVAGTDAGYVAYFNSFYSESASFIFILVTVALMWRLVRQERWSLWTSSFCLLGCILFVTAKPQNVPLAFLIFFLWVRLVMGAKHRVKERWFSLGAAIAVLCTSVWYYRDSPRSMGEITYYVSVFTNLLQHSPSVQQDLVELGLDPRLARYAGTIPYGPDNPRANPEFVRDFTNQMSFGKVIWFYLSHPTRLYQTFDRSAQRALLLRPPLGNLEEYLHVTRGTHAGSFRVWSDVRKCCRPANIVSLLAIVVAGFLGTAVLYWKTSTKEHKRVLEMYAVILAMTVAQFATVSVAQGQINPVKHMFLFNVLADVCLAGALIEFGARGEAAWCWFRRGSD